MNFNQINQSHGRVYAYNFEHGLPGDGNYSPHLFLRGPYISVYHNMIVTYQVKAGPTPKHSQPANVKLCHMKVSNLWNLTVIAGCVNGYKDTIGI